MALLPLVFLSSAFFRFKAIGFPDGFPKALLFRTFPNHSCGRHQGDEPWWVLLFGPNPAHPKQAVFYRNERPWILIFMDDARLVYSTDPEKNKTCPKCRELLESCSCKAASGVRGGVFTVVLRIEKSGRGGKTVTVIDGFPRSEPVLRDMARDLKSRCGSGGTYGYGEKFGFVEIQGDKRELLRAFFAGKGIPCKG